jgi:hypothetical protein
MQKVLTLCALLAWSFEITGVSAVRNSTRDVTVLVRDDAGTSQGSITVTVATAPDGSCPAACRGAAKATIRHRVWQLKQGAEKNPTPLLQPGTVVTLD